MRFSGLLSAVVLLFSTALPTHADERWVSLNQCVDQLLQRWAPEQLAGITYLSGADIDKATHNGTLESVLALKPDRVVATQFSDAKLVARLRDYVPVTVLPQPQSWSAYQQWLAQLAELGLTEQVVQHQHETEKALTRLAQQPQDVVMVMPNQWSWGRNTWATALIERLNWRNQTATLGSGLVALQLEQLIQWQPDRVILEGFSGQTFALANQWQRHPLMQRWLGQQRVMVIDSATAACPVVNIGNYLERLGAEQ